jgi:hypothetical protein
MIGIGRLDPAQAILTACEPSITLALPDLLEVVFAVTSFGGELLAASTMVDRSLCFPAFPVSFFHSRELRRILLIRYTPKGPSPAQRAELGAT